MSPYWAHERRKCHNEVMTLTMNDSRIVSINQLENIIKVGEHITFQGVSKEEKYEWIGKTLGKFRYHALRKKEKSMVKQYIMQMTGYSDSQFGKLTAKKKKLGVIMPSSTRRHTFPKTYAPEDVARLIETDKAHDRLSGKATKKIFEREYVIFGKKQFERLKNISVSHIYNLRTRRQYLSQAIFYQKTKPTPVNIGERRKPDAQGNPGYLRIDTVHQGDLEKIKGVYHINIVDEVIQWEVVGCVEKISEYYLEPLLCDLLDQFPFKIINFHSDNGSEYINKIVARLLNKLLVHQTKSRARHCNDNALAECKNGAIIRKHIGYAHIPQRYAEKINYFYKEYLNPYLNYHRPCGYATLVCDARGKEKKVYNVYQTPYEALIGLPGAKNFLKEGVSIEILDKIAYGKSDNECAALMQKAKVELFSAIGGSASGRKSFRQKLQLPTSFAVPIPTISGS